MPAVFALIDVQTIDTAPPRRLPAFFLLNLLGEYLIEQPPLRYFDPLLLGGVLVGGVLLVMSVPMWLWMLLLAVATLRLLTLIWPLARRVYGDYLLLRDGVTLVAYVMGLRSVRDNSGAVVGAYIDCAIPTGLRRTSVGSVYFPDPAEAERLAALGGLQVICLPSTPGTWRLRSPDRADIRYEPVREG